MDDVMPSQFPGNFPIITYDDEFEISTNIAFSSDTQPNSVVAFFPDGRHQDVTISTHECDLYDRGEDPDNPSAPGEWIKSFTTHEQGLTALFDVRLEHDLVYAADYGYVVVDRELMHPRFYIHSLDHLARPKWFLNAHVKFGYKSTDGWRGHSTFEVPEGWETLTYGWVTGHTDASTARKVDAITVYEALLDGSVTPPVPILWCFGVTSNVFSISSEVMVPDGASDVVNAWLDGLDMTTAERFDNAFS